MKIVAAPSTALIFECSRHHCTGTIAIGTIFVAPNWIGEKEIEQRFFFLFPLFSHSAVNSFLVESSECNFTLVIVSLLTPDIESLLHTHVTFFCIVCIFTSAYSRLYLPSDLYTVRWTVSLSLSRMLVVHLHTQFDWLIYAFSRTPHENSKTY